MTKITSAHKVRRPYERQRSSVALNNDSRTHQSFKDECDLNHMMATYQRTGAIRQNAQQPRYEDLTNVTNYNDAMNQVLKAQEAFQELPAKMRKHFDNDPAKMLDAIDKGEFTLEAPLVESMSDALRSASDEPTGEETPKKGDDNT